MSLTSSGIPPPPTFFYGIFIIINIYLKFASENVRGGGDQTSGKTKDVSETGQQFGYLLWFIISISTLQHVDNEEFFPPVLHLQSRSANLSGVSGVGLSLINFRSSPGKNLYYEDIGTKDEGQTWISEEDQRGCETWRTPSWSWVSGLGWV